ncbi:MAG TPA: polysaccharide biosynthesis/export family protein [Hyphomicrobiaceae bacterium]|nr:polysaccharide biosynthesis/export family protein [Hyphomicrobiaceae bacterium]
MAKSSKRWLTKVKAFSRRQAANGARVLRAVLLMVCAGSLAGCAASLDGEVSTGSLNSAIQTGPAQQEPKAAVNLTKVRLGPPAEPSDARLPSSAGISAPGITRGIIAYKIGAQDVLDVSVFKVPEISRSVQVTDAGTVNLPLLGEVLAAGKTERELERELTWKLGAKYLASPQVTVIVREYNSQRVTIEGAVAKPGLYPIRGKISLLQLIAIAGGTDAAVASSDVAVFRRIDGKRYAGAFDIDRIRAGEAEDPAIQSGDVVVVSTSGMKAAFNNVLKVLPITSLFVPRL